MNQTTISISVKYVAYCLLAVFITFFLHEAAHFITGNSLGYSMSMTLNSAGLLDGQVYQQEWHQQTVSIAGPIFTIIQAIVLFSILTIKNLKTWYPYIFTAALMRTMASVISYLTLANDEARVSQWLNIGKMTLPILVSVFLIFLVIKVTLIYNISWKFNTATFFIISLGISLLIFINQLIFN